MSLNSVNTNVGARTALSHLGATRGELATTQRRIATGLRVASVKDNGASWAIAQRQRGDIGAMGAIKSGLQRSESAVDVAMASGEIISDLLVRMKEKALAAADEGISAPTRTALNRDFEGLRDQITRVVKEADFDGLNLISEDAVDHAVIAGLGEQTVTTAGYWKTWPVRTGKAPEWRPGSTQTVRSTIAVAPEYLHLDGPNVTLTGTEGLTDASASKALVEKLSASIQNTGGALARLGATSRQLRQQQVFLSKLQDGLATGIGNLVDADMGKESAKLQAIQVKETLGIQALGIANRAPQMLLGLFRD